MMRRILAAACLVVAIGLLAASSASGAPRTRSATGGSNASQAVVRPRVAPVPPSDTSGGSELTPVTPRASRTPLYVGFGATFAGALLLFSMLLLRPSSQRASRHLRSLLVPAHHGTDPEHRGLASAASSFIDRAFPKHESYNEKLRLRLERAAWPLRSSEFTGIQALGAAGGALVGSVVLGHWWTAVLLAAAGLFVPFLMLARRIDRRRATFLAQLPDTLQLLAGSLSAGYGFMQAVDTLTQEAAPPTSTEFARVLTEARLGAPVEQALEDMGERIDSEDFRWVVLAINIQRQVGGNLAALLHTVADTLRDRQQVRRQIRVLSAEGRLSAYILVSLPFGLAGYIALVNPKYIHQLFTENAGRVMVAGALALMAAGVLWLRKIIRIDV